MQQPNIHIHRNVDGTVDFDFYRQRAPRQLARRLVFQRGLARLAAYMRTIIRTISGRNRVIILASPGRSCGGRMMVESPMPGSFTEMSRCGDRFDRLNDGPIDYRKILRAERAASRASPPAFSQANCSATSPELTLISGVANDPTATFVATDLGIKKA